MSKFKIGDRVKVLKDETRGDGIKVLKAGEIGKIKYTGSRVEIQSESPTYMQGEWYTDESNLELVEDNHGHIQHQHRTFQSFYDNSSGTIALPEGFSIADTYTGVDTTACSHKWVPYTGIREQFEFCSICDKKRYE